MAAKPPEVTPELIRERMADTRASLAANLERLRTGIDPRTIVRRQLGATMGRLHGARHRVAGSLHHAEQELTAGASAEFEHAEAVVGGLAGRVPGPVRSVFGAVRRRVAAQPLLGVLAAGAVGAVAALVLPGPRRKSTK